MIFKGRLSGFSRDYKTNIPIIQISVLEGDVDGLNDVAYKDLTVSIKEFKQKRSLNANAYMWTLLSAMARHKDINSTDEDLYKNYIQEMSLPVLIDGTPIVVTVKSEVDMLRIAGYWKFLAESPDARFKSYVQLRGSSDFNTSEFSKLLDLIVFDAKALGIETLTPDEIEKVKATWQNQ